MATIPFVRPRVRDLSQPGALPVLLLDRIHELLDEGVVEHVALIGNPGSGVTTALGYLRAELGAREDVGIHILGQTLSPSEAEAPVQIRGYRREPRIARRTAGLRLEPWTRDEVMEYLLSAAPQACGTVLQRLAGDEDEAALGGSPMLWCAVLDAFLRDPDLTGIAAALVRHLEHRWGEEGVLRVGLEALAPPDEILNRDEEEPEPSRAAIWRRHPFVRQVLAAHRLAHDLGQGRLGRYLESPQGSRVLRRAARSSEIQRGALEALEGQLERVLARVVGDPLPESRGDQDGGFARNASLILHSRNPRWLRSFAAARGELPIGFRAACLAGLDMSNAEAGTLIFTSSDLRRSFWSGARVRSLWVLRSQLAGSTFRGAVLGRFSALGADLSGCDLRGLLAKGALFQGAKLAGADLRDAVLDRSDLRGQRLRDVRLEGCGLNEALLTDADLEGLRLEAAQLAGADLTGALLTESHLPRANLRGARLNRAGLAEVVWERADLREADFTQATFHLGSSRSGTLFGYPSQGTRTGFYTDDLSDTAFRRPEEVRRASLRGSDLRGAKVEEADFYLVDLRGVRCSDAQRAHFRACGAILSDRAADAG